MQHHAALPQQTWATEEHSRLPSSSDPRVFNPTSSSSFVSEGVDDPELAAQQRNGVLSQDDEGGYTAKGLVNSTERGLQHTTPEGRRQQMKDIFSPDSRTAADDVRIGGSSSNDSSPQAAAGIFSSSAAAAAAVSSQTEEGHEEYSNAAAFLSPQRGTIGSSAVASNSNEDFFFSRDPLLLPRRNHTIGAGTTPNRKRIDSHFMFPSQGPTSPGQNSLSAITGGKDVDDDEWEAMIKSRRSLVPGEDDREDTSHHNSDRSDEAAPWQRNTSLAHAQHRRFPSQPSSVRAVSPFLSGAHSPVASRQTRGGADLHKRSESASIRSLEQGPFASASTYVPSSSEGLFANLDPSMIRRHQSLNHATGRAMASRLQGSSRKNLYANRPHDSERTSPVASLAFDANSSRVSPGPGYDRGEMSTAAHLSPEAVGLSPSHSPASTLLSTSLLDAHARLSRMSIHPSHKDASDAGSAATTGRGQQLHSLVTNRDALETAALYSSPGKRDVQGPASAAAYVPPIGHAHFRQQESSPSYGSTSTGTEGDVHSRSDPVRGTALQGPFSALPTSMPWPHQGPSTVGKPSTMVTSQLETAREESPMMDNNGFDGSQNRTIDAAGADRAGKQASLDSMAMNIAVLQQRLLSQQQQLQQPHRSSPHSVPHLLQQPQQQYLHHPHQLSTHAGMQQQQQQQHPAMLYGATQPGMMDMRHSPQLTSYNPMFLDNSGLRAHQPHFSHINNLPSNSRPVHPQQHAPKAYAMPPSSSQPTVPVSTTISPALAALIVEKGYNPSPAQFDITAPRARFFVIKSFTEDDVQRSLKHEIWASTEKGNQRLDRAFKECEAEGHTPLYLFYSVNASGHFCGMAQMMSALDYNSTSNVWVQEGKWKGTFRVKWIFVKDVPNVKLRHIKLTNTVERKAVTQSRDTQELPTEGGKEVLRIMAEYQMKTTLLQDWLFYEQSASLHHQQRNDGPPPPPISLPASQ